MNDNKSDQIYVDRPLVIWIFAAAWLILGIIFSRHQRDNLLVMLSVIGVPLAMVLLSPVVTVRGDRQRRVLSIRRRYVWRVKMEEITFDEIAAVQVGENVDSDGDITYRVEFILKNGQVVPLRKVYTSGHKEKVRLAQELEEYLALESETAAEGQAQPAFQEREGVRWRIDYQESGSLNFMVWFSPDARLPNAFLFLAQYPTAQRSIFGQRWFKTAGKMLLKQALRMHSLNGEDIPDLENAQPLTLPSSLSEHFLGLSDEPQRVDRLLTPWIVRSLSEWGQRHPVRQGDDHQLTLLLGPRGLSLRLSGGISGALEGEVIALGIDLVKALPRQVA